jgi:NAD(P)-dependent dehydrogenase (short-subunit alcohol dehydrogenase family)
LPTVVITGANRGLGLEFARQYARDGWRVHGICRNPDSAHALCNLGPSVEVHQLDVADRNAIQRLAHSLRREPLDLMIANAGVMTARRDAPPEDIPEEAWLDAFRINTIAPLMCASAFAEQVALSAEKKMVVMSSWIGSIGSNTMGAHYVYRASKSALNAIWRSFAIDHPELIVVALSPGALRTDMTRYDGARWEQLPEPAEHIAKLRAIIARLEQADSGSFFHFNGERLPW